MDLFSFMIFLGLSEIGAKPFSPRNAILVGLPRDRNDETIMISLQVLSSFEEDDADKDLLSQVITFITWLA